jgi:hypothetical protein
MTRFALCRTSDRPDNYFSDRVLRVVLPLVSQQFKLDSQLFWRGRLKVSERGNNKVDESDPPADSAIIDQLTELGDQIKAQRETVKQETARLRELLQAYRFRLDLLCELQSTGISGEIFTGYQELLNSLQE